jgi:putative nucleotidyltransferase with HDIG domain
MSPRLRLYVSCIAVVGLVALLLELGYAPLVGPFATPYHVLFLVLLGCALEMMRLPLVGGGRVSVGFAVFFASLLLVGPALAAGIAAVAVLWAGAASRRREPLLRTFFSLAHTVLAILLAGATCHALGGRPADLDSVGIAGEAAQLGRVIAAAGVMFLFQAAVVSLSLALERGASIIPLLRANVQTMGPPAGAMTGLGFLLALLYSQQAQIFGGYGPYFIVCIILIPAALLYYSFRLRTDIRGIYERSLHILASIMEAKLEGRRAGPEVSETLGHSERVAALAVAVAEQMNLPPAEVETIRHTAYLHDIGKIGIPAELLHQPVLASESVRAALRRHALIGYQILSTVGFLSRVALAVRHHHERYDGLGYPDGLRGRAIPLAARVVRVAEEYDAVTHHRVYRRAVGMSAALDHIRHGAGSRFDPQVVAALVAVETAGPAAEAQPIWRPVEAAS